MNTGRTRIPMGHIEIMREYARKKMLSGNNDKEKIAETDPIDIPGTIASSSLGTGRDLMDIDDLNPYSCIIAVNSSVKSLQEKTTVWSGYRRSVEPRH
jgi:hypothetical protein